MSQLQFDLGDGFKQPIDTGSGWYFVCDSCMTKVKKPKGIKGFWLPDRWAITNNGVFCHKCWKEDLCS